MSRFIRLSSSLLINKNHVISVNVKKIELSRFKSSSHLPWSVDVTTAESYGEHSGGFMWMSGKFSNNKWSWGFDTEENAQAWVKNNFEDK